MFNAKLTRFASLLLAFGLLLGLAVTGCSDKDRDNAKEPVKMKTMTYSFDLVGENNVVAKGIPETAEYLNIVAIDTDKQHVDARLAETEIAKMALDGGSYAAQAEYAETADSVVYTFYHMDGDQKVADCNRIVGVANLADGAEVEENEDQALVFSYEILDVEDPTADQCELAVDDDLYVCVFIGEDEDRMNVSGVDGMDIVTDNSEVVDLVDYSAERDAVQFIAVGEGTANLSLQIDGIKMLDIVAVNVTPSVAKDLYFVQPGIYEMDEDGHLKINDENWVTDPAAELVPLCKGVYPSATPTGEEPLEYQAFVYVGQDENDLSLFDMENVPADEQLTISTVVEGGKDGDFTATYAGGIIYLDIADTTVVDEVVNINVSAPGFEGKCPIEITII